MQLLLQREPSGHVFKRSGARGAVWYAKYRLPDGRQRQQRIGPAWPHRGRPARGYSSEAAAKERLAEILMQARQGTLPGQLQTGVSFADACAEYLRWIEFDRERKPSTVRDYRSIINAHLIPALGAIAVEDLTTELIERWSAQLTAGARMCNRTKLKILTVLHGVMKRALRVYKLPRNPVAGVEKPLQRHRQEIDVFCPEEVFALVRAAESAQDGAIFLTAAFTGLRRGELVALRWRAVDFPRRHIRVVASYTERTLTSPKSDRIRSVPMAPLVAETLARLANERGTTSEDDLVFPGILGDYLDASALYRRYKAALSRAGLRDLRFHDLRHTFGTQVISNPEVSIVQLKEWMGHADIDTTMKYLHYAPRESDADLVARAFAPPEHDGHRVGWSSGTGVF
jgi:integrase